LDEGADCQKDVKDGEPGIERLGDDGGWLFRGTPKKVGQVGERFCRTQKSQEGDKHSGVHGVFPQIFFEGQKPKENKENPKSTRNEGSFMN
jgi:hypothetical protein